MPLPWCRVSHARREVIAILLRRVSHCVSTFPACSDYMRSEISGQTSLGGTISLASVPRIGAGQVVSLRHAHTRCMLISHPPSNSHAGIYNCSKVVGQVLLIPVFSPPPLQYFHPPFSHPFFSFVLSSPHFLAFASYHAHAGPHLHTFSMLSSTTLDLYRTSNAK
jgi:hypothetical protein